MNELNLEVRIGDLPEIANALFKQVRATTARLEKMDNICNNTADALYWIAADCERIMKLLDSPEIDDACRSVLYYQMAALSEKLDAYDKGEKL